jgi:hypothetical protein
VRKLTKTIKKLEDDMRPATKTAIVIAVIGTVVVFFLTVAMSSLTMPSAQATPTIAKGKACTNCHTGSTPSKGNLKK